MCGTGICQVVVQVGDVLDRGEDEIAILSLLAWLGKQARNKGGAVFQVFIWLLNSNLLCSQSNFWKRGALCQLVCEHILVLNGSLGRELVALHTQPSMFGGSMEVWMKKHSILDYWWSNSFWDAKRCLIEFGPQWSKTGCSLLRFKHYLWACTRSGKKLLILYAKPPLGSHKGQTHDENPFELKDNFNIAITLS